MTMTQQEFEDLVNRLENYAKRQPTNYKIQVGLLAILGHVYIVLILALLMALIAALIGLSIYIHQVSYALIKLVIVLFIPVFIILQSLWNALTLRIPPPQGINLERRQVPQLFALVDELTESLQCPPFHHIVLIGEFNAAVLQIPRFLLMGKTNYLLVGLPLLHALSVEQFKAVLAHEFGHLSGNHSRFQGWIYQMRHTWGLILERLQQSQQGGIGALFFRFFNWYIPFFNAYSFVLARANEYEADACAAKLTNPQVMASALVNVHVKGQLLDNNFWRDLYEQVNEQPEPPKTPFNQLVSLLKTETEPTQTQQSLQQALEAKTNCIDTHPCLSDRLKALHFSPEDATMMLGSISENAAESLLGKEHLPLTEQLNQHWNNNITFQWKERYNHLQQLRVSLQTLEQKALTSPLSIEEMWERARLTTELKGPLEAIPLLQTLLNQDSSHPWGNFLLGQILLSQQDETGIKHLEIAMNHDPNLIITSYQVIYYYLQQQGREKEAEKYLKQAQKLYSQR